MRLCRLLGLSLRLGKALSIQGVEINGLQQEFREAALGDNAGDRFAHGTVGGVLQVFDQTGAMVWQRRLGGVLLGHNALDMTSDGSLIVAGSAGETGRDGYLELFDRNGALLWQTRHGDGRDAGTIPMPYSIDHNQRGVISVAISDDGRRIVAGYGDSTIRIFERRP